MTPISFEVQGIIQKYASASDWPNPLLSRLSILTRDIDIANLSVCLSVCEIFSVKEWRDLKNQVTGRSRSLKMAPFDRPYATLYWSAIVNIALTCTIFELFDVE